MTNTFIQAALILLREGLEALLVIAALAAFLRKSGKADRLGALYAGAGTAVVASIVMAWVFAVFNSGAHNDLVEACVILAAAALMLYVSGWLMLRQDPRAWQGYLEDKTNTALVQRTALAIAGLAFLAVFREGAETVLFIQALATTSGGWSLALVGGLAVASAALVVLFVFINAIAARLPLRPVFIVTSAFLFAMAIKFIGAAIQEFQEQSLLPVTDAPGGEVLASLGLNATYEALGAQVVVILLAVATYMVMRRRVARTLREVPAE
jgi:high-affinity iron transporter